ncbi:hypothetical protein KAFR_0E01030 [Kazachstania africana CBS 2517]|uniref:Alpha-1,2-mannosyltransferase MNN2 n=1 Tax=Kazachstania africana (strain ATCC 22294 / BCRC 22015 / CBS 2517 / CECT 1963 / NBRC 1671 / NRRL Y-8276) TaxID=1071382 RepID=H2AV57_KAZAF|nr:hypothetical protein KAFR_0E01030 [Kazachstania africana CBS 2517]CCF58257.1 hypothetical protein KAFR_0E01030 [Kazachstania africana CBS 2517]
MLRISRKFSRVAKLTVLFLCLLTIFIVTTSNYQQDTLDSYKSKVKSYLNYYTNGNMPTTHVAEEEEEEEEEEVAPSSQEAPLFDNDDDDNNDELVEVQEQVEKFDTIQEFYDEIFNAIISNSPTEESKKVYGKECIVDTSIGGRPGDHKDWHKLTYDNLSKCLQLSDEEVDMLHTKHKSYVSAINQIVEDSKELLNGQRTKKNGIVMVGGGKYSLLSLLSVMTIRKFGTTLPVEVFIPRDDELKGDFQSFCNELLPQYNAKCIFTSNVLSEKLIENFHFNGYQHKSLALLASSFDNILLLDSDNHPIKNLDSIFKAEPFVKNGMVLWPDFWRRTTSPKFYQIAGIPINKNTRVRNCIDDLTPLEVYNNEEINIYDVPFHDTEGTFPDMSSESGQLLINRNRHLKSILLALYYNYNGPAWYYSIFSQGAAGEGDKETFIAGAHFYGLPYYQVKTFPSVSGYHQPGNSEFRGVAILQHDLVQDYQRYQEASIGLGKTYEFPENVTYDENYSLGTFYNKYFDGGNNEPDVKEVDFAFVHANFPKFDPVSLAEGSSFIFEGQHFRSFTDLTKLNGYDIEYENFVTLHDFVCVNRKYFPYIEKSISKEEYEKMCRYISDRLQFLRLSKEADQNNDVKMVNVTKYK